MRGVIIGVDEVGLGPIAGPVVACAFAAPDESWTLEGIDDSKKLSARQLTNLSRELMRYHPKSFEIAWGSVEQIDEFGLGRTHMAAMETAILRLIERVGVPHRVIVDGVRQPTLGAECHPKADSKFPSVSAASIIAKVARDEYMVRQSIAYPQYGFESHVGYDTAKHRAAIVANGICPLHRRSVKTIKNYLATQVPTLTPGS